MANERKYRKALQQAVESEGLRVEGTRINGRGHICLEVAYRGRTGKIHASNSPSDLQRVMKQVRYNARQKRRELLKRE